MEIEVKLPRRVSGEELSVIFEEEVNKITEICLRKETSIMYEPGSVKETGSVKERVIGRLTVVKPLFTSRWKWFIFYGGGEHKGEYHVKLPALLPGEYYGSLPLTIVFELNSMDPAVKTRPLYLGEYEGNIESILKKLLAGIYQNRRLESPA